MIGGKVQIEGKNKIALVTIKYTMLTLYAVCHKYVHFLILPLRFTNSSAKIYNIQIKSQVNESVKIDMKTLFAVLLRLQCDILSHIG
jgi:hypothetical protein